MSRILRKGYEDGSPSLGASSFNAVTIESSIVRTGIYSISLASGGFVNYTIPTATEYFFRIAGRWNATAVAGAGYIFSWWGGAPVGELGSIRMDTANRQLIIYIGTNPVTPTTSPPSPIAITASEWFIVEANVKIANSGGYVKTRVDKIGDIEFAGDTQPGTATTISAFRLHYLGVATYFDDLAVNDTAGGSYDSWCGDGRMRMLRPDGDQLASLSVFPSGSNWQAVDESPHDADTTYVYGSTTLTDKYTLGDISLPSNANILWVRTMAVAKDNAGGSDSIQLGIETAGSPALSGNIPLAGSYAPQYGDFYDLDPDDSLAWSQSKLDAMKAVVKIV